MKLFVLSYCLNFTVINILQIMAISIPAASRATLKFGLVTGGCKDVGLQIGLSLAKRLPSGSLIFLTTKDESKIPQLTEELKNNHDSDMAEKIRYG